MTTTTIQADHIDPPRLPVPQSELDEMKARHHARMTGGN